MTDSALVGILQEVVVQGDVLPVQGEVPRIGVSVGGAGINRGRVTSVRIDERLFPKLAKEGQSGLKLYEDEHDDCSDKRRTGCEQGWTVLLL